MPLGYAAFFTLQLRHDWSRNQGTLMLSMIGLGQGLPRKIMSFRAAPSGEEMLPCKAFKRSKYLVLGPDNGGKPCTASSHSACPVSNEAVQALGCSKAPTHSAASPHR